MEANRHCQNGMPVVPALETLIRVRTPEQIVITNQASARIWPQLSQQALDFHYNPSTMGGAIPLGLGLALAQPRREVLVVSGDGSLLMSLGALVTVAGSGAGNLSIVVLENGVYEVTGGQRTPAATAAFDLVQIARGAGFASAVRFDELSAWQHRAAECLGLPGPRFIALQVQRTPQGYLHGNTQPVAEQLLRLKRALASGH